VIDNKLENAMLKLDYSVAKQKSIANRIMLEHNRLQEALAEMLSQADYDCPSQYRTEHFRSAMKEGYILLRKVGYFKKVNND